MCEWSEGIRSDYKEYFQCGYRCLKNKIYDTFNVGILARRNIAQATLRKCPTRVCISHHCGEDLSEEESDCLILTGTV